MSEKEIKRIISELGHIFGNLDELDYKRFFINVFQYFAVYHPCISVARAYDWTKKVVDYYYGF